MLLPSIPTLLEVKELLRELYLRFMTSMVMTGAAETGIRDRSEVAVARQKIRKEVYRNPPKLDSPLGSHEMPDPCMGGVRVTASAT